MASGISSCLWTRTLLFLVLAGMCTRIGCALFLSPLAKIPAGHWSARLSSLWIFRLRWSEQVSENEQVLNLHREHGSVVQLAPYEISVASVDAVKKIFTDGLPVASVFTRQFTSHDTPNMFTMENRKEHANRKRMMQTVYNKSSIFTSGQLRESTRDLIYYHLLPCIEDSCVKNVAIEVCDFNRAYAMDAFTRYQFGAALGSRFMLHLQERKRYFDRYFRGRHYFLLATEFLGFFTFFSRLGISVLPRSLNQALLDLERWNLDLCDKAEALIAGKTSNDGNVRKADYPVIFATLRTALRRTYPGIANLNSPSKQQAYHFQFDIASENYDQNLGAHEASGNTLTYCLFEISRNLDVQQKLCQEMSSLNPPIQYLPGALADFGLPEPREIDACPYLDAIVLETLRIWPVVPRARPRLTTSTCSVSGYDKIPPNVKVQYYPYVLHRNKDLFPEPEVWRPERWTRSDSNHLKKMKRSLWSFGDGDRMCIGMHFALLAIKQAIAAIYSNFTSTIYEHGDMRLSDGFVAGPKGDRLYLKFRHV